jgi:purine nucleosidase
MQPIPVMIDCDPGVDDAIALLLAFAAPELQILGITTVAGNVPLSVTQTNARRICELANRRDTAVYAGCPRPLMRRLETAEAVHGATGLVGVTLPEPLMPLQSQHGVSWLIQTLLDAVEPITVATLGPLTNLAVAIVQAPQILPKIRQLVLMGGAITHGNVTASAEFNLYCDPHAAQIVFESGVPLVMISLDVTHTAIATPDRLAAIRAIGDPLGTIVADLLTAYGAYDQQRHGFAGAPLHDPCVIAYLLQPELFQTQDLYVAIETQSQQAIGRTIVDWWGTSGQAANVRVAVGIDAAGFYGLLGDRLNQLNQHLCSTNIHSSTNIM